MTYGIGKGQPRSNPDTSVHSPSANIAPKKTSAPIASRLLRSFDIGPKSKKEEDNPPGASGATAAPTMAQAQAQSTTASNVYDLPSSDDETSIIRRKRRRPSHDANKQSPVSKRTVRPRDTPCLKPHLEDEEQATMSPKSKKPPLVGEMPSNIANVGNQQSSIGRSSYSRAVRPVRGKAERSVWGDTLKAPADESSKVPEPDPMGSPNANHRAGNITPGRKRLIDSLGSTKPSLENPPQSPAASQQSQVSVPRSPNSPNVANEDSAEPLVQASPPTGPPQLRSSGVTYARQRSFLDDMLLEEEFADIPGSTHRSQSIQRQLMDDATSGSQSVVASEGTNDDGSVRSIHELRQAGGNARYRGAVESIFEDIEDTQNSLSGRCNALLQLCGKLLDIGLKRRFVECNFDKRLVDCLSMDDRVLPTALVFSAYALGSSDGHMSYVLATSAWPKLIELSPMLLGIEDGISEVAKAQRSGLSRPLQKTVQDIVPRIFDMLFPEPVTLRPSPCTLALYCLKSTISTMQIKGENPSALSTPLLESLIRLLLSESQRCISQDTSPATGSQKLCLIFSVLEALTASPDSIQNEHRSILGRLSTLHGLFNLKSGHADVVGQHIQPLLIRVILNVTNSNRAICDEFANREMVGGLVHMVTTNFGDLTEDALGQENNSLDIVILALGALINLTEQSEASRSIFLHSSGSHPSFLDRLLHLFTTFVDSISTVRLL